MNINIEFRQKVFEWLNNIAPFYDYVLDWKILAKGFRFNGEIIPLIGARGIWKPKMLELPISITTVLNSQYSDTHTDNDLILYSYRGTDQWHSDNIGLRKAMEFQVPIIYFSQVIKGKYFVSWPVYIVGDNPEKLEFTVLVDDYSIRTHQLREDESGITNRRKYQTREMKIRLHQKGFRERVLQAYTDHCAICRLKHRELLDAAHIIPDSEGGVPIVSNGLSLCKIHHAAFDKNIMGISPDYQVEVREDILNEIDGPMLKYGLQEMNGTKLYVPRSINNKPSKEGLEIRYNIFKSA